jgi:uncharacterized protein YecE (DUF72 family)
MGDILIGISSWTEKTLVDSGRFYPDSAKTSEARLKFYASQFPIVEVDSSYYAIPPEKMAGKWVERTPPGFVFDVKAFRVFTHHPTMMEMLPPEIRLQIPSQLRLKRSLYYRDLPKEITDQLWQLFEKSLLPLDNAGKLGVVLFQFPPWFMPSHENLSYLASCQEHLPRYRIAVEFRHYSWVNEKNLDRTFSFLKSNRLIYVCVDEPQGFRSSLPPVAEVTADIGIVRFHGRNTKAWDKPSNAASGRFNYLYSESELKEWVPRIKDMASRTMKMHVFFNNCFDVKPVINARTMGLLVD